MKKILVADVMTREPITIEPNANLLECAKKMVRKRVGSLLIINKKEFMGFISEKDILWALIKKSKDDLSKINVIDISPKKISKIKPSSTIEEAVKKMKKLKLDRLPVVHEGELVGVITIRDILSFHPEFHPELKEFSQIREEARKLKSVKNKDNIRQGICEECGKQDVLHEFNGTFICESCRNSV
jgi:CBS domain-containing protein